MKVTASCCFSVSQSHLIFQSLCYCVAGGIVIYLEQTFDRTSKPRKPYRGIKPFTPAKTITPATQGTPAVLRPGYKNLLFPWKRKLREGAYAPSHGNSLNSCKKHHYRLSIQAFSIFGILTTQLNCCEAGVKKYFLIYALAYAPPPPARLTPEHQHFFALDGKLPKFPGLGTLQLSNPGRQKEGKCPVLGQYCNIFH